MRNCRIKSTGTGMFSPQHPDAPLGWVGRRTALNIEIVGIPDDVTIGDVVHLANKTAIANDMGGTNYRLPFARLKDGGLVFSKHYDEINRELAEIDAAMSIPAYPYIV